MAVTNYDAPGRYLVESSDPKRTAESYMVDLFAWAGHGQCNCEDWTCRIGPHREAGTEPPKRFCKHIAAARETFTDEVIARFIDQARTQPEPEHQ
jgi:hypothetical protein